MSNDERLLRAVRASVVRLKVGLENILLHANHHDWRYRTRLVGKIEGCEAVLVLLDQRLEPYE